MARGEADLGQKNDRPARIKNQKKKKDRKLLGFCLSETGQKKLQSPDLKENPYFLHMLFALVFTGIIASSFLCISINR